MKKKLTKRKNRPIVVAADVGSSVIVPVKTASEQNMQDG